MCEPTTIMLAVSAAIAVVGGMMQMQAQQRQAANARNEGVYRQQIANNNAIHANNVAHQKRLEGETDKSDAREAARQAQANVIAGAAGRGVLIGEGSNVDQQGDIAMALSAAEANIDYNTELDVIDLHMRSINFGTQGQLAFMSGENQAQAAEARGRTAFVSALGQAAGSAAKIQGGGPATAPNYSYAPPAYNQGNYSY